MTAVLLDTHTWAWSLAEPGRVSANAKAIMPSADAVSICTVSLYEIAQKVRLGKWPEMAPHVSMLDTLLSERGVTPLALTAQISVLAGLLDWPHRDPFDRLIAATALATGSVLVSADNAFDSLPGLRRIW